MTATIKIATAILVVFLCSVNGLAHVPKPPRFSSIPPKIFNVMAYGARGNGNGDNRKAFLAAWKDACAYPGRGRVLIPQGVYELGSVTFEGGCNGSVTFLIRGTLRAPSDPQSFFTNTWIGFLYVDNLTVKGGGYLDGQGHVAWKYNDCNRNSNCKPLPSTIRLDFVKNALIYNIKSINSKNTHISLFACDRITIRNIRLYSPADSPNTDGIHIGSSRNINILNSAIRTGDDCVGMVSGSHGIQISGVSCGPGHGISIGSLGRSHADEEVYGISVRNSTFYGTDNGVRIKTWASSLQSLASNITFEDINMRDVMNPIVIDQDYCPNGNCQGGESSVQIKDVMFRNIWGTSSSKVAVKLKCSGTRPCKNVKLENISLAYNGRTGRSMALCTNVQGSSFGTQIPESCI